MIPFQFKLYKSTHLCHTEAVVIHIIQYKSSQKRGITIIMNRNSLSRKEKINDVLVKAKAVFLSPTVTLCALLIISILLTNISDIYMATSKNRLVPIYSVAREDKYISLTIDAAWGNQYTQEIIDILDRYNVHITFFTVQFWAEEYPEDIEALKLHGHEIGNHSSTHPDMATLSKEKIEEELLTTWETQLKYAGSSAVRLFRAPYGSYNNTLIETCAEYGFYCIQWDVDSIDWKEGVTAKDVINRVLKKTKSGSIILMHNNSEVITQVLPVVLEQLIAEGYTFVPVSQLIYKSDYTIDANGVQHKSN